MLVIVVSIMVMGALLILVRIRSAISCAVEVDSLMFTAIVSTITLILLLDEASLLHEFLVSLLNSTIMSVLLHFEALFIIPNIILLFAMTILLLGFGKVIIIVLVVLILILIVVFIILIIIIRVFILLSVTMFI